MYFSYNINVVLNQWNLPTLYIELVGSDGKLYASSDFKNSTSSRFFNRSLNLLGVNFLYFYVGSSPQDKKLVQILRPGLVYNLTLKDIFNNTRGTDGETKVTITDLKQLKEKIGSNEVGCCLESLEQNGKIASKHCLFLTSKSPQINSDTVNMRIFPVASQCHFYVLVNGTTSNIDTRFDSRQKITISLNSLKMSKNNFWIFKILLLVLLIIIVVLIYRKRRR